MKIKEKKSGGFRYFSFLTLRSCSKRLSYTAEMEGHLILFIFLETIQIFPLDFIGDAPSESLAKAKSRFSYQITELLRNGS